MFMVKNERSQTEIIQDLLLVTLKENEASKTKIMQRAYLNQKTFKKYFIFLTMNDYLIRSDNIPEKYTISQKGKDLLEQLRQVNHLICLEES